MQLNSLYFHDVENLILLVSLITLFIVSMRKRDSMYMGGVDKGFSNALKGVSCFLILQSHYYSMNYFGDTSISWIHLSRWCGNFSATIALCLFMFISGYGLVISNRTHSLSFIAFLKQRILKLYKPLVFVSLISLLVYFILPESYSLHELSDLRLNRCIYMIHHVALYSKELILFALGWLDWYVFCIMLFYLMFWVSEHIMKSRFYKTIFLLVSFIGYYILAYNILGRNQAHFYRYPCIFMSGYLVACYKEFTNKQCFFISLLYVSLIIMTIINESIIWALGVFIAFAILAISFVLNKKFVIKGKNILWLGGISYYVYLIHTRIGFAIINYIGIDSMLLTILITIVLSYTLKMCYNKLSLL